MQKPINKSATFKQKFLASQKLVQKSQRVREWSINQITFLKNHGFPSNNVSLKSHLQNRIFKGCYFKFVSKVEWKDGIKMFKKIVMNSIFFKFKINIFWSVICFRVRLITLKESTILLTWPEQRNKHRDQKLVTRLRVHPITGGLAP